jgi:hypothetical protein
VSKGKRTDQHPSLRRRSRARKLWLPEEDRIIERYARALAGGQYESISAASRVCAQDIERLYAALRRTNPHHPIASRERPFASLRHRMKERLDVLSLPWAGKYLTPQEERVVSRHVRGVVNGRYHDTRQAAEACIGELSRLSGDAGRVRPLSVLQVRARIYRRLLKLKLPWAYTKWSAQDAEVAERYARAIARGDYSTVRDATVACHSELAKRASRAGGVRTAGRPLGAVKARLCTLTGGMGLQKYPRWNAAEQQVVDRYLKALYAGRYCYIRPAAEACATEMRQRFRMAPRRPGVRLNSAGRHSAGAVYQAMVRAVIRLGLPRYKGETTCAEQRVFERYARDVSRGRFRSCVEASRACATELRRVYARAGKSSAMPAIRLAGRSPLSCHAMRVRMADSVRTTPSSGSGMTRWSSWSSG